MLKASAGADFENKQNKYLVCIFLSSFTRLEMEK